MRAWRLRPDRAEEALDVLCRVFPEFPGSDALKPAERRRVAAVLHARTIEAGFARGRIDAWGDPVVGLGVWLVRPSLGEPGAAARASGERLEDALAPGVMARLEAFDAVLQRLRARARPDRHLYLDMLGVLHEHRRRGVGTALLAAGHAWADEMRLPCALDTDTSENVAFYQRRGYRELARAQLPGSDQDLVAMRRDLRDATPDPTER